LTTFACGTPHAAAVLKKAAPALFSATFDARAVL